jgi:hypothetical protein
VAAIGAGSGVVGVVGDDVTATNVAVASCVVGITFVVASAAPDDFAVVIQPGQQQQINSLIGA